MAHASRVLVGKLELYAVASSIEDEKLDRSSLRKATNPVRDDVSLVALLKTDALSAGECRVVK